MRTTYSNYLKNCSITALETQRETYVRTHPQKKNQGVTGGLGAFFLSFAQSSTDKRFDGFPKLMSSFLAPWFQR
jgi:hypothetical protein